MNRRVPPGFFSGLRKLGQREIVESPAIRCSRYYRFTILLEQYHVHCFFSQFQTMLYRLLLENMGSKTWLMFFPIFC